MIETNTPETIALEALAFLAADDIEIGRFLRFSGLSPDVLRATAGAPDTLRAVMEYVLGHETTARNFAEEHGYRPDQLARAAHSLGALP
jgi:hypothetical protein